MKRALTIIAAAALLAGCANETALVSPNGRISVNVGQDGRFSVYDGDALMLSDARLGYVTASNDWSAGLKLSRTSKTMNISEEYEMMTGKRSHCGNEAAERTYTFKNAAGAAMKVVFRAYNDGVAFKYVLDGQEDMVLSEGTVYPIADGVKRWMQVYSPDSYERMFPVATDGKAQIDPYDKAQTQYGYPSLLEPEAGHFMLITEGELHRGHPGSFLDNTGHEESYNVVLASDSLSFSGSWESPWRLMIVGSLADVVESTLVTDTADPSKVGDTSWIHPGVSSWIYWAYNRGSSNYQLISAYIDLAAEMGWPYSLFDDGWNRMNGEGTSYIDAFNYAREKGVKPMVWYNCGRGWAARIPFLNQMSNPEKRIQEFTMLRENGVAGVKIDFFPDDKAETIDYYIDLLEDAAKYQLTVTFHGATIPRGWQRTYPHLMTIEGVYGAEWYNNGPYMTTRAASHNATLPFTRNVVGPMDYTPGTFTDSQNPHITTDGHELALLVVFESAMQHMPDRPSAYAELPEEVRAELSVLPTVWDDTKLLAGYPRESVVIARRSGDVWYVAGLNGRDEDVALSFSLDRLGLKDGANVSLYADGTEQHGFTIGSMAASELASVPCLARGGFMAVIR